MKSPELKAKKAQKRKLKVAAERTKVNSKVAFLIQEYTKQRAIDQTALMMASKEVARLQLEVGKLKGELIEARMDTSATEAPANV